MQDAAPREFPPSQETREIESKFQANSLEACRSGLAPCSAPQGGVRTLGIATLTDRLILSVTSGAFADLLPVIYSIYWGKMSHLHWHRGAWAGSSHEHCHCVIPHVHCRIGVANSSMRAYDTERRTYNPLFLMVPGAGIEPAWPQGQRILSSFLMHFRASYRI